MNVCTVPDCRGVVERKVFGGMGLYVSQCRSCGSWYTEEDGELKAALGGADTRRKVESPRGDELSADTRRKIPVEIADGQDAECGVPGVRAEEGP
jgi:hypothetical protein